MKYLLPLLFIFSLTLAYGQDNAESAKPYKKILAEYRKNFKADFLNKDRSPLDEKGVKKVKFYKANASFNVMATFNRTPYAEPFDILTYSGLKREYQQYGTLYFTLDGKEYSLAIYQNLELEGQEKYKDYLFLPFKDNTNGETTYGGGRYINLSIQDIIDGNKMPLDFNKAYNPWCAYSDGFNCPIPPNVNHLTIPIQAGERSYKKK